MKKQNKHTKKTLEAYYSKYSLKINPHRKSRMVVFTFRVYPSDLDHFHSLILEILKTFLLKYVEKNIFYRSRTQIPKLDALLGIFFNAEYHNLTSDNSFSDPIWIKLNNSDESHSYQDLFTYYNRILKRYILILEEQLVKSFKIRFRYLKDEKEIEKFKGYLNHVTFYGVYIY